MKRSKVFSFMVVALMVGMFIIPAKARALTLTLSQADLLLFAEIDEDPTACCGFGTPVPFGSAGIATSISLSITSGTTATIRVGLDVVGGNVEVGLSENSLPLTDVSGFDDFKLQITNNNDENFLYRLWAVSGNAGAPVDSDLDIGVGAPTETVTSFVSIAPGGGTSTLFLDFSLLNDDKDLEGLGFDIQVNTTICPDKSCGGEQVFASVPEPTTMLLLGSGLLGLMGVGYRRRRTN